MALPERKGYAGAPVTTTLSSLLSAGATSCTVGAVTGWPASFPYFIVIEPGTSREEKVKVTAATGTTLTIVRNRDNTNDVEHPAASTVYVVFTATEADEANQIASVMTTKGDLITTNGSTINRLAVGATNTHVLQVDSTATNGIKWGQVATAGIADSAVTSAKIQDATIVAGDIATNTLKLLCPVGTISAYGGGTAPTGWLLCDGSSIDAGYTELRALVGTTTPNMTGRFPVGTAGNLTLRGSGGSATITEANMPSHTHSVTGGEHSHTATDSGHSHVIDGRADDATTTGSYYPSSEQTTQGVNQVSTASASANITVASAGSGHTHTVSYAGSSQLYYPPFYVVSFIIKHDY